MSWKEKLIIAIDTSFAQKSLQIVEMLGDDVKIFKIGIELFISAGPKIVRDIQDKGKKIFLDLKFHDIPNTVSKTAIAAARLGVYMFNIHTSGGFEMMERAKESVEEICIKEGLQRPKILGVTVLTSINKDILKNELAIKHGVKSQVLQLSSLALKARLDGVVASPSEIAIIKEICGKDFIVVTPGIRPSWSPPDDQKRTSTPKEALQQGADYIIIGRSILKDKDPLNALELISLEMMSA